MGVDITVFRHGGTQPLYDDNGEEITACLWEQVANFACTEHVMKTGSSSGLSNTMTYGTEQERRYKTFYIEVRKQEQLRNYNVRLGDYINEDDCKDYWWKVLGINEIEVTCNCWWLIIKGEWLTSREIGDMRIANHEVRR